VDIDVCTIRSDHGVLVQSPCGEFTAWRSYLMFQVRVARLGSIVEG